MSRLRNPLLRLIFPYYRRLSTVSGPAPRSHRQVILFWSPSSVTVRILPNPRPLLVRDQAWLPIWRHTPHTSCKPCQRRQRRLHPRLDGQSGIRYPHPCYPSYLRSYDQFHFGSNSGGGYFKWTKRFHGPLTSDQIGPSFYCIRARGSLLVGRYQAKRRFIEVPDLHELTLSYILVPRWE